MFLELPHSDQKKDNSAFTAIEYFSPPSATSKKAIPTPQNDSDADVFLNLYRKLRWIPRLSGSVKRALKLIPIIIL